MIWPQKIWQSTVFPLIEAGSLIQAGGLEPEWSCLCSRPPWLPLTSLIIITSTVCSIIAAHNRRSSHISSRCISPLQLAAIWHPIIPISARLPPTFKNIPFFTILPQYGSVTLLRFCGHRNSYSWQQSARRVFSKSQGSDCMCSNRSPPCGFWGLK